MILIGWWIISLAVMVIGLIIWQPWWVKRITDYLFSHPRYFCKQCHHDIKVGDAIRAEFNDINKLEGR